MNADEANEIINRMRRIWPQAQRDQEQIDEWYDTLVPIRRWAADEAISTLKFSGSFWPAHDAFKSEVAQVEHREALQHQERMLGKTGGRRCDCESGFVRVSDEGVGTVKPCPRCRTEVPADQHKKDCTCLTCHYGVEGADQIRRGFLVPERVEVSFNTGDEF